MTQASIRNAPTNKPGKKPARKTAAGNLLYVLDELAEALTAVDEGVAEVEVAEADAEDVVEEELDGEVSVLPMMLVFLIMVQIC
jgi:phosphoribosylamine-glycine ligase